MERELALEIVRVTEAAALASAQWMGRGKKNEADDAATTAMRDMFDSVNMAGTVVIGEGELDEAPMLYIGEELGTGNGPEVDIAVDPLEGTNIVAKGLANAMAVIANEDSRHREFDKGHVQEQQGEKELTLTVTMKTGRHYQFRFPFEKTKLTNDNRDK